MTLPPNAGVVALCIWVLVTVLWLASVKLEDASIVDPFWSVTFAVVAVVSLLLREGEPSVRFSIMVAATVLWGLRLFVHLMMRARGEREDRRYQAMRARHPPFWLKSYFIVFLFQGALAFVISLPLQVGSLPASRTSAGSAVWIGGAVVFAIGFLCEAVADLQLTRFKKNPDNQGRVMDRGLWRYSRHPNYFGNAVLWWGLFMMALAVAGSAWTVVSPALMTFLLLKVSGVALLEKDIEKRRPAYADYIRRTSAFVPWPPRSGASAL